MLFQLEWLSSELSAGCLLKLAQDAHNGDAEKDTAVGDPKTTAAEAELKAGGKEQEGHNGYIANYVLDCANPSALTSIEFDYFKVFAGAKALTVNVVSQKAQNTYEVTRDRSTLGFAVVVGWAF